MCFGGGNSRSSHKENKKVNTSDTIPVQLYKISWYSNIHNRNMGYYVLANTGRENTDELDIFTNNKHWESLGIFNIGAPHELRDMGIIDDNLEIKSLDSFTWFP